MRPAPKTQRRLLGLAAASIEVGLDVVPECGPVHRAVPPPGAIPGSPSGWGEAAVTSMPVSVLTRMPVSVGAPVPPVNDPRRGRGAGERGRRSAGAGVPDAAERGPLAGLEPSSASVDNLPVLAEWSASGRV